MKQIGKRGAGRAGGASRGGLQAPGVLLAVMTLLACAGAAAAQSADCGRLLGQIRAAESDNGQRDSGAFDRAAQQQRYEIDRTRHYAEQLGCKGSNGLFGDDPPPECPDIEDRLSRMQDNLEQIEARAGDAGRAGDSRSRREALVARYNATCVGTPDANPANLTQGNPGSFMQEDGQTPSDLGAPDDLSMVPLNGDIMQGGQDQSRVAGRTICVRTCDGGYFPLAPHATTDQLDGLEKLCQASCPNTEARLYTMRGDNLGSATAVDGSAYSLLPAAFKFEKSFSPTCTCKPPGQTWTDALANAEQLLEKGDHRDVTVTAAISDQMAKPLAPPPVAPAKGKAGRKPAAQTGARPTDAKVAVDGARAAQAPTASNESSGIGGLAKSRRVLGQDDGLKLTTEGPDGSKRRIRLIVP